MGSSLATEPTDQVVLASAQLASEISLKRIPSPKDLFLLSAAVINGDRKNNRQAVELALECVAGLLDHIPPERDWDSCRGHLKATMDIAWLLLKKNGQDDPYLAYLS